MNKSILIFGFLLLIAGIAVWGYLFSTNTHHTIQLGGIGLAVLGALLVAGGVMMKPMGAAAAGQFTCAKCGAKFGSQAALDQHNRDKHGM